MKASKWLVITLATAVAVAGGIVVFKAQAAPGAQSNLRARILQRVKEKLELTPDQAARIKSVIGGEKETLLGLISRLRDARVSLREAIQAPNANETTVRAASARVAVVEADLAVERLRLFGQISSILSAEQRGELKEIQARIDELIDNRIGQIGARLNSE
jgi:Spy/CpxP family protein refolding chaperone